MALMSAAGARGICQFRHDAMTVCSRVGRPLMVVVQIFGPYCLERRLPEAQAHNLNGAQLSRGKTSLLGAAR